MPDGGMVDPVAPKPGRPAPRAQRRSGRYLTVTVLPGQALAVATPLWLAVAKKKVPSAPVRNTFRRVMREAWRAVQREGRQVAAGAAVRVHVHALPIHEALPTHDERGRALPAFGRRWTDRALKRLIRAEAEGLLRQVCTRGPAS